VVYDSAIALLQEAVQRAAGATIITNLANVGIARSFLNKNDVNHAIEYAQKVDPTFTAWVKYVDSDNFGDWVNKYNLCTAALRSSSRAHWIRPSGGPSVICGFPS